MRFLRALAPLLAACLAAAPFAAAQTPADETPSAEAGATETPATETPTSEASAAAGAPAAAEPLSVSAFSKAYAATLADVDPTVATEIVAPLEVRVTPPGGAARTSYLSEAYRAYLAAPEQLETLLATHAAAALADRGPLSPDDSARLVPVLVSTQSMLRMQARLAEISNGESTLAAEPLNEALSVVYALDSPASVAFLRAEDIAALGVAPQDLRQTALTNLRQLLLKINIKRVGALYLLQAPGEYDASLLLFDDVWAQNGPLGLTGPIVAAAPSRGVLMAASAEKSEAVSQLRDLAAEIAAQSPDPLTPALMLRSEEEIEVYRP